MSTKLKTQALIMEFTHGEATSSPPLVRNRTPSPSHQWSQAQWPCTEWPGQPSALPVPLPPNGWDQR